MYIGVTTQAVEARWAQHISDAKRYKTKFSNAIKKYGAANFEPISLYTYETREAALTAEMELIAALNCQQRGYNSTIGGDRPPSLSGFLGLLYLVAGSAKKSEESCFDLKRTDETFV